MGIEKAFGMVWQICHIWQENFYRSAKLWIRKILLLDKIQCEHIYCYRNYRWSYVLRPTPHLTEVLMKKKAVASDDLDLNSEVYLNGTKNVTRTTIFLTDALNDNLEALALTVGEPKGVLVRKAVSEFLKRQGMQPHRKPKVSVSY